VFTSGGTGLGSKDATCTVISIISITFDQHDHQPSFFMIIFRTSRTYCKASPPSAPQSQEKLPPSLWRALQPFQKEGVSFVVNKEGRALIADEMGLGKHATLSGTLALLRDEKVEDETELGACEVGARPLGVHTRVTRGSSVIAHYEECDLFCWI
jgi:hypothetical protein